MSTLARRLWSGELGAAGTVLGALLVPPAAAYASAVALRNRAYDAGMLRVERATVPVISIGNVAVGGTGKTPFSNWLARRLLERGRKPALLHGGYAADEPELHRRWDARIPVIAGRDRVRGAAEAVRGGADVIVLDDAFQHRRLARDLDIVLVAAERWAAPRRLLPRGPWREPASALRRADLVVVTRKTAPAAAAAAAAAEIGGQSGRPVARAYLRPAGWRRVSPEAGSAASGPAGGVVLVAGIAEPDLFAVNAREAGADVAAQVFFPDHHEFSDADVARVTETAAGRPLVTTEKDWTRLQRRLGTAEVWVLGQDVIVEDGLALLDSLLDRVLT